MSKFNHIIGEQVEVLASPFSGGQSRIDTPTSVSTHEGIDIVKMKSGLTVPACRVKTILGTPVQMFKRRLKSLSEFHGILYQSYSTEPYNWSSEQRDLLREVINSSALFGYDTAAKVTGFSENHLRNHALRVS